jgi:hypothetical protein
MMVEAYILPSVMIGVGVYWFFTGFRTLKSSRTIQNIPTCRISTGAVGAYVEINGKILKNNEQTLKGPISNQICAFYSIKIQKLVRTKDHEYWKTIDQFFSDPGLMVDDNSGAIAKVYVYGATVQQQGKTREFEIGSNDFASMPEGLTQAIRQNESQLRRFKLKKTPWLFSSQYRFLEWNFGLDESVYVLGYAESGIKQPKQKKLSSDNYWKAKKKIEADSSLQNRFDRNQDGFLSSEEMERGAQVIGHGLQVEPPSVQEELDSLQVKMIFRKRKGVPYILSNMKEKDLVQRLSRRALWKVAGGPVVAIAGAIVLFYSNLFAK